MKEGKEKMRSAQEITRDVDRTIRESRLTAEEVLEEIREGFKDKTVSQILGELRESDVK